LIPLASIRAAYRLEGKYSQAEPLLVRALEIKRRVLGEVHHSTATAWNNLAALYRLEGKLAEAEPIQLKAVEVWRAASGDEGPETLSGMSGLATLHQAQKRYAEAEGVWTKVLEIERRMLGAKRSANLEAAGADTWKRYYTHAGGCEPRATEAVCGGGAAATLWVPWVGGTANGDTRRQPARGKRGRARDRAAL
jgi:tetratricopeptide (TPR) repeat protein